MIRLRLAALLLSLVLPVFARPAYAQPRTVRISAAGDLVLNPHAMASIADDGEAGYQNLVRGYGSVLSDDSINFVNLEQPLVRDVNELDPGWPRQDTSRPRRSPILGTDPALADALAEAGVHVAGLANNHAYDQGRRGLLRTLEELTRVGMRGVGAGATREDAYAPVVIERDGVRVAFVGFTDFFNRQARDRGDAAAARLGSEERVEASLAAARAQADVVVAAVHWNRDFVTRPGRTQRRRARALVDAGADIILGTGPHVLHSVERLESPRGQAVVAYSLGNVISGMGRTYRIGHPPRGFIHPANVTPEARDGAVLRLSVSVDEGTIQIDSVEAVPLWTENNWLAHRRHQEPHRITVTPLAAAAEDVRGERWPLVQRALGDDVTLVER